MRINFIEIQNFRKLESVRIDLATDTTVLVGANNSGKTTAMTALRRFLIQKDFNPYDFPVASWQRINAIGQSWERPEASPPTWAEWEDILPSMDVWLEVDPQTEIHYVPHLLPTLDWNGEYLGVRLRLEPTNIENLYSSYRAAHQQATITLSGQNKSRENLPLWPTCLKDFIERSFDRYFCIRWYILDPTQIVVPSENGLATPQPLPTNTEGNKDDPFKDLIRIREINAQRGFSDAGHERDAAEDFIKHSDKRKLSEQLRAYYSKHLDPTKMPTEGDLSALEAIHTAQKEFDKKLADCFSSAFREIQELGYPGISDPTLKISTQIKPMDGLNHPSALQYAVISNSEDSGNAAIHLPEKYNGLGYQNLISMVFRLMSFRDEWLEVGKAHTQEGAIDRIPPLLLVLIEEPEAHLHVQVQQVFIRKAYDILRKGVNPILAAQLVVSTHSSHIAHECEFSCLRYFRRHPAATPCAAPTSTVINLSTVFGSGKDEQDTARFVAKYIKAAHSDLFFADAAIFIEGAAERILLPYFIERDFQQLHQRYVTLLEVGGSYAHKFEPLIRHLGLITLLVTDIDAVSSQRSSVPIARGEEQITCNPR